MEWTRGEEYVSTIFQADDARKLAVRSAAAAGPNRGPNVVMGCIALPFFLAGACLTTVHHQPAANALGYAIIVLLLLVFAARQASARPSALPSARSVFTVVITPTTLTQLSDGALVAEVDLADIADVTATDHDLVIVRRDASQLRLTAPAAGASELAADVDARVREMRSLRGGYR